MKPLHRLLLVAIIASMAIVLVAGASFLLTHPRCEVCGRRYGPLISHPYRHSTAKEKQIVPSVTSGAMATAPVINNLPPLTDANRNLTLSAELLVGRWESQDGSRSPIVFSANGDVEVGFIREGGDWLMSTGTFHIDGDRVVTRTRHEDIGLSASFKFARGVLYAPRGPSPQVVWQRIGDL